MPVRTSTNIAGTPPNANNQANANVQVNEAEDTSLSGNRNISQHTDSSEEVIELAQGAEEITSSPEVSNRNAKKNASKYANNYNPHHVVLGAGMIGCYLAACLQYAKQTVSIVARPNIIDALGRNFSIADFEGNHYQVNELPLMVCADTVSNLPKKADVLWLTVKCLSVDDALATIRNCITDNTIIICCQNGVGNHISVQQAFSRNCVIRAMVPFNVVSEGEGHFHRGSDGHLILERDDRVGDFVQWLARQINSVHLPVDTSFDMTAMQWAKLQLNLGNAVCALADIPVKQMLENTEYRRFISKMMIELLQVSQKKKIKLPKIANLPNKWIPKILNLPTWLFKIVAQKMLAIDPKVRTSMWWDIQAERLTEIDYLNGKVVACAQELGLKAPANSLVVKLIKQRESGQVITPSDFLDKVRAANAE
jgi:2-dehydropantoate 2-reductase